MAAQKMNPHLRENLASQLRRSYENTQNQDLVTWAYCTLVDEAGAYVGNDAEARSDIDMLPYSPSSGYARYDAEKTTYEFIARLFARDGVTSQEAFDNLGDYCARKFLKAYDYWSYNQAIANNPHDNSLTKFTVSDDSYAEKILGRGYRRNEKYVFPEKNSSKYIECHRRFQKINDVFERVKNTSWDEVQAFIDNKPRVENAPAPIVIAAQDPLTIAVPVLDEEGLRKKIEAIQPGDYMTLSQFGREECSAYAKAMANVSEHIVRRGTKPRATIKLTENMLEGARELQAMSYISEAQERGFFARIFNSRQVIRIEPEFTPFRPVLEACDRLKAAAETDTKEYFRDVELTGHGKALAAAHYKACKVMYGLLREHEDRLKPADDIFSTSASNVVEVRLQELQKSMQSAAAVALSYDMVSAGAAVTAMRLGGMEEISVKMRLPMIQALHRYQLYGLRRMQELGQVVDEKVLSGACMTKDALNDYEAMTPAVARDRIGEALRLTIDNCAKLEDVLRLDMREQEKRVARLVEIDLEAQATPEALDAMERAVAADNNKEAANKSIDADSVTEVPQESRRAALSRPAPV